MAGDCGEDETFLSRLTREMIIARRPDEGGW